MRNSTKKLVKNIVGLAVVGYAVIELDVLSYVPFEYKTIANWVTVIIAGFMAWNIYSAMSYKTRKAIRTGKRAYRTGKKATKVAVGVKTGNWLYVAKQLFK